MWQGMAEGEEGVGGCFYETSKLWKIICQQI